MSTSFRPYPGAALRTGEGSTESINAVQQALAALGLAQGFTPGVFDAALESAVRLFQSRHVDLAGHALKVDGIVGSFTWAALFGPPEQPASPRPWRYCRPRPWPAPCPSSGCARTRARPTGAPRSISI